MNILLTAFKGHNNSSKVLLDLISSKRGVDELYLDNNFQKCESQMNYQLDRKRYDTIFSFDQMADCDQIIIETSAKLDGKTFLTTYSVDALYQFLKDENYKVELSKSAGNDLANHIYAVGLERIAKDLLTTQMVLLYIPSLSRIDILKLAKHLSFYFSHLG